MKLMTQELRRGSSNKRVGGIRDRSVPVPGSLVDGGSLVPSE
jgi:hypothetical protein